MIAVWLSLAAVAASVVSLVAATVAIVRLRQLEKRVRPLSFDNIRFPPHRFDWQRSWDDTYEAIIARQANAEA